MDTAVVENLFELVLDGVGSYALRCGHRNGVGARRGQLQQPPRCRGVNPKLLAKMSSLASGGHSWMVTANGGVSPEAAESIRLARRMAHLP